jgi:hypothetical protein
MGAVMCCEVRDSERGQKEKQTPYKEKQTDKKPKRKHRKRHLSDDEDEDIELDSQISVPSVPAKRGRKSIRKSEYNPRDDMSEHKLPPLKTNNPDVFDRYSYPMIQRDSISAKNFNGRDLSPKSKAASLAASTKDLESDDNQSSGSSSSFEDEDDEEWGMGFV